MTFKFKDRTGNTPLLSSDASTEAKEPQSSPLAGQHSKVLSTPSMTTTNPPSASISTADNADNKRTLHALMFRAALLSLKKAGLLRWYRVLSRNAAGKAVVDATGDPVVKEIRIVLDPKVWTEDLRLLSDTKEGVVG